MGTGLKFLSKEEVTMKQGTILGSQIGRWIILAALVAVMGAVLTLANTSPGLVFGQEDTYNPPGAPDEFDRICSGPADD